MKLRNWLLALVAPISILTSCLESKPVNYLQYVVGEWTLVRQSDNLFVTDSIKIMNLKTDFSVTYAYGLPEADGRMIWEKQSGLTFNVDGDMIILQSAPNAATSIMLKMQIESVNDFQMICILKDFRVDGVQRSKNQLLNFERSVFDFTASIVGIWQSRVLPDGNVWIWNIKRGGMYDFYIYNPTTKQYVARVENSATYNLYGRYFVCQYKDSVVGEAPGMNSDVWLINEFGVSSMILTKRDAKGVSEILPLIRITKLP